jgi:hypothetical protein
MKPNKLETQLKAQLNARKIHPTEMAWERLDAMLSVAEEKKTNRFPWLSFQFIGVAASILVFVSLGLFFFNQKETLFVPENNVGINEEVIKDKVNSINSNSIIDNNGLKRFDEQAPQKANQQKSEQKLIITKANKSFNQINQITLVNQENKNQLQNQKVIAMVDSKNERISSDPSALNVDNLLASAQKESKSKSISKIIINANSILSQVDGELDQTFREKALNKISKNYKEIKVALQTRNQEQKQ